MALWRIIKEREISPEGREDPDDKIRLVMSARGDGEVAKTRIVVRRAKGVTNPKVLLGPYLDDVLLPTQIFKLEDQEPLVRYEKP